MFLFSVIGAIQMRYDDDDDDDASHISSTSVILFRSLFDHCPN